ncbi:unnamed protein product [Durusdinium trenchii]|uniref:Uncharacterized protein n=1 Tax=Durusdinium trenchii TaxID=1381693 RepID=A0ABP0NL33_9DINO
MASTRFSEDLFQAALLQTSEGGSLSFSHMDLGTGTDCEELIFQLKAERELRNTEKAIHVKKKSESAKAKDFAVSAQMRREANAGIESAEQRLSDIDTQLQGLEEQQKRSSWFLLFSLMQAQPVNRISRLDLGNCGLHATGLDMLQKVLLDLEHRGDGLAVEELVLDGNDFGDAGTVAIASLLRLSSKLRVLRLRNVGITDGGFSQMISAMVSNKSLVLLDLRGNGLCSLENSKIALQGLRRFNTVAEVLLE